MSVNLVKVAMVFQCTVFENKRQTGYGKVNLFSCAISYGVSNKPEAYLEPTQTCIREHFGKNR